MTYHHVYHVRTPAEVHVQVHALGNQQFGVVSHGKLGC